MQCAIDYIESLHSVLEYYQNITQQIATINPDLYQFVSSTSPPPTPTRSSHNPIPVVSAPQSPNSSRTDQSGLSQGTNISRRGLTSPGSSDISSNEVSWISQVLQFSSPSRSPNNALLTQFDIDFEKMLQRSPQYSPGNMNPYGNVGMNQYPSPSMQTQSSPTQQPSPFNQYSSFLDAPAFDEFNASPVSKTSQSHSHSWKAPSSDLLGIFPQNSAQQATPAPSNLEHHKKAPRPPTSSSTMSSSAPPSAAPKSASFAIKLEPGPQTLRHNVAPAAPRPSATTQSQLQTSQTSQPSQQQQPQFDPFQPQPAFSMDAVPESKPSLTCEEDVFDWSSVSSTPNQTPDRKPIPSLEALSDSLQSLTVSKANAALSGIVIKQEK